MLGRLIDRLVKKEWTESEVRKYIGSYMAAYLTHAADPSVRSLAASGGTTTALLVHGLETGHFDGAIVCRAVIEQGKVRARFMLATSPEEILAARGSKYIETAFLKEVLPLIRDFKGRLAVVGLPCDITNLTRRETNEPEIADKIALKIALVCGHNSRVELIDSITRKLEKETGSRLTGYRFSLGSWRGQIEALFEDGTVLRKPSKFFKDYQNLFFFCTRKCMACHDHYGYNADLTAGDVWLFRLKSQKIKHTGLVIRTSPGQTLVDAAVASGALVAEKINVHEIMDGQARIGPAHYNVSARAKVGRLFSLKLKDTVKEPVSWHAWLNALLTVANMRLSEKPWGKKLIFLTPRPVLKVYLYFKKGLETIR